MSILFDEFARDLLNGDFNYATNEIEAYLVDVDEGWPTGPADSPPDLEGDSIVAGPVTLTSKSVSDAGWLKSDDLLFTSVSGSSVEGVYFHNKTTGSAMLFLTGTVTPDGNNIAVPCPANGWFRP